MKKIKQHYIYLALGTPVLFLLFYITLDNSRIDYNNTQNNGEDLSFYDADNITSLPIEMTGTYERLQRQGLMAISLNSASSAVTAGASSNLNWSHTIGSGNNRILTVNILMETGQSTNMTYGGTPLTLVGRYNGAKHIVEIWQLVAPPVGTANIVATFSGSIQAIGGAAAYDNVDQTSPTGIFQGSTGTASTASVTVSSATDELVIDAIITDVGCTITAGANQTQQWSQPHVGLDRQGRGSSKSGDASVTMSWTGVCDDWTMAAVPIKPAGAGVEICNNSIDDDFDGLVDCADPDCSANDNDGDQVCDGTDLDDDNDGIPDLDESGLTTICPLVGGTDFPSFDYTNCGSIPGGHLFTNIGIFNGTAIDMTVTNLTGVTLNCGGANGCNAGDSGFSLLSTDNGEMATFDFFESGTSNPVALNWSLFLDDFDEVEGIRVDSSGLFSYILNSLNGTVVSNVSGQLDFQSNDNNEDDLQLFFVNVQSVDIEFSHTSGARNVCFSSTSGYVPNNPICSLYQIVGVDTDGDGVDNHLDLDSDNDGILDVDESGHSAADSDDDGIIDGAAALFGTNGLFDALETLADNDTLNFAIADSESAPDGTYDAYELDSDEDGCNDTEEESIADGDSDGIAGTGVPAVDANGLVTAIIYATPGNNNWQNPAILCVEICNNGIDDDGDGLADCADSDCCCAQAPTLSKN